MTMGVTFWTQSCKWCASMIRHTVLAQKYMAGFCTMRQYRHRWYCTVQSVSVSILQWVSCVATTLSTGTALLGVQATLSTNQSKDGRNSYCEKKFERVQTLDNQTLTGTILKNHQETQNPPESGLDLRERNILKLLSRYNKYLLKSLCHRCF